MNKIILGLREDMYLDYIDSEGRSKVTVIELIVKKVKDDI